MLMKTEYTPPIRTPAARRALLRHGRTSLSDLRFLEEWATTPGNNTASILRAGQIRRTNSELMRAIAQGLHQPADGQRHGPSRHRRA